jgi:hypothetical protein
MKTASTKSRRRTTASWHLAQAGHTYGVGRVKKEGEGVKLGRGRVDIG